MNQDLKNHSSSFQTENSFSKYKETQKKFREFSEKLKEF